VTDRFPVAFTVLRTWAAEHGVPVPEARIRFAQYAILYAIAGSRALGAVLVFKGGNALDFVWQPNRSTIDLDFSADLAPDDEPLTPDRLKALLGRALADVGRRLGLAFAIHRVEQQPPGPNRTFITYTARIGYALPDDTTPRARLGRGQPSPLVIPVEISLNEVICATETIDLGDSRRLRISTIEDIVAEKMRALLQQPIRNRLRPQDLLDIAVILRHGPDLDRARVADFLLRKAAGRHVPVSRAAFRHPEIAARASQDYAALRATTRSLFIPVDEALAVLLAFVADLEIPEHDAAPERPA
jgi:predicted nucleotidyltransferase component of viral defense system